jgi:hypothetical protein
MRIQSTAPADHGDPQKKDQNCTQGNRSSKAVQTAHANTRSKENGIQPAELPKRYTREGTDPRDTNKPTYMVSW